MEFTLSEREKRILLTAAREAIARGPAWTEALPAGDAETPNLAAPSGAFVTLHKHGELRGCIGSMNAAEPLLKTVRAMAREAAFGDPRFPPLGAGELEQCAIEISVLSPLTRCADPSAVTVGVHGLYLAYGGRRGVLLPQVPVEQGWDRAAYLDYICVKAGLPQKSFEKAGAELYTFTALVFGENGGVDAP
ncbi:MAG: AmmeMemoRadiSam system protein A [Spirochaetaceae bacterium]|jgi:AmmeMemoRadiSam system protein A|nr:AmmeMemoRadiSam system protein A [Spirochaetaceae bacterium]